MYFPVFSSHFTNWFTDAKCWHNMLKSNVDSFPWTVFCSIGEALLHISSEIQRNLINILLLPISDYPDFSWDWRSTWWVRLFCYLQPCQNDEVAGISSREQCIIAFFKMISKSKMTSKEQQGCNPGANQANGKNPTFCMIFLMKPLKFWSFIYYG